MGFDFDIEYKAGSTNTAADALSRRDSEVEIAAITVLRWIDWDQLHKDVAEDPIYAPIVQSLRNGEMVNRPFTLVHDVLYYKDRLAIPATSPWVAQFLAEFHNTPMGGHAGALRTYRRLAASVYWPGMIRVVTKFVADCLVCQRQKADTCTPGGLLQPLPMPSQVWEDISMDFISSLPRSQRFDVILVVVDRLTKACHFIALSHPFSSNDVAAAINKEVVRLHGIPRYCD